MSENSSSVNEETKNVIRGVTPPEPKLLGTYINMVPITDTDTSKLMGGSEELASGLSVTQDGSVSEKTGGDATSAAVPTTQFPMSAMNMEQLQQFMMRMQINAAKPQPVLGTSSPALGAGIGLSPGISAPGLGATMNMSNMMPSSAASAYNIPPVGALDPNVLASLGMNVQKPTLQPIQFPNMQAGVPNLCGIQGQDLNLAAWMQKQKIAIALSELQNSSQMVAGSSQTEAKASSPSGMVTDPSQGMAQPALAAGIPGLQGGVPTTGAVPTTQSQLTPQLAAFLGNPNLVPTKGSQPSPQIPSPIGAGVCAPGMEALGTGAGMNLGVDAAASVGGVISPESVFPAVMQPNADMSKIEAMIKQQQQQFISSQLNAAAQLLRQHGIQATIGTEPLNSSNSEVDVSKSKKPALLQRIAASKVNPKIFIVPNALNQDECDEVISLIQDRLESSKISISKKDDKPSPEEVPKHKSQDSQTGETDSQKQEQSPDADQEFCRSTTACIQPEETPLIREIENRLGLLVDSSSLHMEPILVHKYSVDDYIKEHHDGDNRTYTISVFLSDVQNGGELDFPYAGIKIKPKKGMAVVWPNVNSQGKLDYTTVHAVNKITQKQESESQSQQEQHQTPASYLLYLHINKEPVRLGFEASKAVQQVVVISETPKMGESPKVITQVTYPASERKNTKE
ncbi:prolyl 4-hydroxylase alpha subunit [Cryptosporidium canis]|uniref:Prolyl 4-hydroxylase alpha subunit n=1 Tax=Cryptosporidium canis TaxID=195482 RepID=A0A9D5HWF8_9CRYT|nr:prolyl 4-hydroxylase alpha subunit [Cryptosporidium canis]